jgi:hypothetical protein
MIRFDHALTSYLSRSAPTHVRAAAGHPPPSRRARQLWRAGSRLHKLCSPRHAPTLPPSIHHLLLRGVCRTNCTMRPELRAVVPRPMKANCDLRIDASYQVLAEIGAWLRPMNTTFNGVSRLLHLSSNDAVERRAMPTTPSYGTLSTPAFLLSQTNMFAHPFRRWLDLQSQML